MTAATAHCTNCESPLARGHAYCPACGQRALHGQLTMHDIGHDLLHAITHADHSILSLVKELALRPGRVAREYADGKRKKYLGPFAFLFISVAAVQFFRGRAWWTARKAAAAAILTQIIAVYVIFAFIWTWASFA